MNPSALFEAVEIQQAASTASLRSLYALDVRQLSHEEAQQAIRSVAWTAGTISTGRKRVCPGCNRTHQEAGDHNLCGKCRDLREKERVGNRCPVCNVLITPGAARCQQHPVRKAREA